MLSQLASVAHSHTTLLCTADGDCCAPSGVRASAASSCCISQLVWQSRPPPWWAFPWCMSWQTRRRSYLLACQMTHHCQGYAHPLKTPSCSSHHSSPPAVKLQAEVSPLSVVAGVTCEEKCIVEVCIRSVEQQAGFGRPALLTLLRRQAHGCSA